MVRHPERSEGSPLRRTSSFAVEACPEPSEWAVQDDASRHMLLEAFFSDFADAARPSLSASFAASTPSANFFSATLRACLIFGWAFLRSSLIFGAAALAIFFAVLLASLQPSLIARLASLVPSFFTCLVTFRAVFFMFTIVLLTSMGQL